MHPTAGPESLASRTAAFSTSGEYARPLTATIFIPGPKPPLSATPPFSTSDTVPDLPTCRPSEYQKLKVPLCVSAIALQAFGLSEYVSLQPPFSSPLNGAWYAFEFTRE